MLPHIALEAFPTECRGYVIVFSTERFIPVGMKSGYLSKGD
jgi:hypothetical protein